MTLSRKKTYSYICSDMFISFLRISHRGYCRFQLERRLLCCDCRRIIMFTSLISYLFLCVSPIIAYNFNVEDVSVITEKSVEGTYFSYSLLLQKGNPPVVLVGAPKDPTARFGGSLYRCDIQEGGSRCLAYDIRPRNNGSFNGNFLGLSLDGDGSSGGPFVVCAPRKTSPSYYVKGSCFWKESSSVDRNIREIMPVEKSPAISIYSGTSYYDFGYAEVGLDVAYDKEKDEILMGAPGVKDWNGVLITWNLKDSSKSILPHESGLPHRDGSYRGYKVSFGKFARYRHFYIMGAPRARILKGSVIVFEYDVSSPDKTSLFATLTGTETGAGFGSAILACDVTGDGLDDLIVGAPMAKGASYDEGYAEFYRIGHRGKFENGVKILGQSKQAARFGSSMMSLGDIDLDGFNDVAISAPYEDSGVGAVYVYRGGLSGLTNKYSQKLSPLEMNLNTQVKGFGLGLSRGNDIDGNGHNDLAVGAYQTSQVFVFKSKNIINATLKAYANVSILNTNSTAFKFFTCVSYSSRYENPLLDTLTFRADTQLDYRSMVERNHTAAIRANNLGKPACNTFDVYLKSPIKDISKFKIVTKVELFNRSDVVVQDQLYQTTYMHFAHGCGDDDSCKPKLKISVFSSVSTVIPGLTTQFPANVVVENFGEPSYQTDILIQFPQFLELRNLGDCTKKLGVYFCPFKERLTDKKEKEFIFDINMEGLVESGSNKVSLNFEVKTSGLNQGQENKTTLGIPVSFQNSPFIVGKPDPETVRLIQSESDIKLNHAFSVGNLGPSPVKLDLNILVPVVKLGGRPVFEVTRAKGTFDDIETQCFPTNRNGNFSQQISPDIPALTNKTAVLSCGDPAAECVEYSCKGEYLYKSSKTANFEISITAKSNLIGATFEELFPKHDAIAFVTSAYLQNARIEDYSVTVIFAQPPSVVPIWIYIVGTVVGLVILLIIIFLLYKCHFFDRNYKNKLNEEKLLDKNNTGSTSTIQKSENGDFDEINITPELEQ